MKSIADGLPAEIAAQIHPDWRKNESHYWEVRDSLLDQYEGSWIAFSRGRVIAADRRPMVVYQCAHESGEPPFVTCVGREQEGIRMRRSTFAYDTDYDGEALPVLNVEFRTSSGGAGVLLDHVIADTGVDATALPWAGCQTLQLNPQDGTPAVMRGVADGVSDTLGFFVWAYLDGREFACQVHVDFSGTERLLGRDVLNSFDVLFRGPSREVVINP